MTRPLHRIVIVLLVAALAWGAVLVAANRPSPTPEPAGPVRASAGAILIGNTTPANNETIGSATPTIVVPYVDPNPNATVVGGVFTLDGMNLTSAGQFSPYAFVLRLALELRNGPHLANIAVFDSAGGFGSASWFFTVDTVPPILLVTSPVYPMVSTTSVVVAGTAVLADPVLFAGAAPINVTAVVLPSGASNWTYPGPDGSFRMGVPLTEGVNTIFVNATDRLGNFATVIANVVRDTVKPTLTILTPTLPVSPSSTVWVSGKTDPGAYVFVNGFSVAVSPIDGAWGVNLTLPDGLNIIQVVAADQVGNLNFGGVGILVDTTVPKITLTSPTVLLTNNNHVRVAGTVEDTYVAALSVNGNPVAWNRTGAFSTTVLLPDGTRPIVIVAADAARRVTVLQLSMVVDTTPPIVTVITPPDGLETNQSTVVLRGSVNEENATVLVGSAVIRPDASGHWQTTVALTTGANTIVVSAIDVAGNPSAAVLVHVTYYPPYPDLGNRTSANAQSIDELAATVRFGLVGIVLVALAAEFYLYSRNSKKIRETRSLLAALLREKEQAPKKGETKKPREGG